MSTFQVLFPFTINSIIRVPNGPKTAGIQWAMPNSPIPRKIILSICKDTEKCYKKDIDSVKKFTEPMFFHDILFRNHRRDVYFELYQLYINRLILCFGVFSKGSVRCSQILIWLYAGSFAFKANT